MVTKLDEELKEILINEGIVTPEQLARAEEVRKETGKSLAQTLVDMKLISEATLTSVLAKRKGLPFVDLGECKINASAVAIISEEIARRYLVFPIDFEGDRLVVAMADPANVFAIDDLRIVTGYDIKPVVSTESDILSAINHYYRMGEALGREIEGIMEIEEEIPVEKIHEIAEEVPIVKLVNLVITRAIHDRASDIHIEPQEKDLRVRYRIDGVLHEVMRSPRRIQPALTSRIKIMAGMDIAECRKPQDGHCGLTVGGKAYDFRVATLPTVHGERVVLRILEKESILMDLNDLGFLPESLKKFKSSFTKPYGTILVTGPTGSGKSTTLYAVLNVLNIPEKNIVTIEDPVEYRLHGINQIQINPKAGLTFARGLRSILRSSPDIIMIGEIRDRETAQIAIEAALTGHLVLSTLHTNDAPGAITRLTEMGIPPFLVSSAVDCVQAQRLARRLCKGCKESYNPSTKALKEIGFPLEGDDIATLYRPKGCSKCNDTGYKGRIGIYEIMLMSETIKRLTVEKATAEEIKEVAIAEGMRTLRQDGFEKVRLGITSIEEIMRVIV
ncbi:MAG: ATPase, T2SS/T4P/T4SS family [Actinomycetota bacterium]|nr:ATPase, T2SS/T4P/T4SS family [Actinomycetota bacterium]MDI6821403.1 ATPase, T2SS/T4P/T4SS family [Actinomycetota bacterium]